MSPTSLVLEDSGRREYRKQRLYVIFQLSGWGMFLFTQLFYMHLYADPAEKMDPVYTISVSVMVTMAALLISHCARSWINAREWKQLGWRQLLPRMVALAFSQGFILNLTTYGYSHWILQRPWESKYSFISIVISSLMNSSFLFFGWLGLYFFYHLYDRFNRSEIERFQLMTSVKDAELRALKSQVNPHFIFNSLNSLRALIDEDPARARHAVTQLANLLRYALQSAQRETVPFEEELDIVNDYLALEQVRHEERLRLRLDVAPDTLALPVPPMLLQTLVENAVKYGISNRPEGGEITIIARRESDVLRLQVTNPGDLTSEAPARPASTGLGLNNAADRLKLIFGERASLSLKACSPSHVMAEATIPLLQPS